MGYGHEHHGLLPPPSDGAVVVEYEDGETGGRDVGNEKEDEAGELRKEKGRAVGLDKEDADGDEIDEGVINKEERLKEEMDECVERELGDRLNFNRDPGERREIGDWVRGVGKKGESSEAL